MKTTFRTVFAAMLLVAMNAHSASTYTIDFSNAVASGGLTQSDLVQSDGFDFTSAIAATSMPSRMILADNGDQIGLSGNTLAFCPGHCELTMQRTDGTLFGVNSADIVAIVMQPPSPYTVTGHQVGGGTVFLNTAVSNDPVGLVFGAEWTNLERIVFGVGPSGLGMVVDNISVTAVPIPAALWLFASALGIAGWTRRARYR